MVISYDDWKKSYEWMNATQKQQYADMLKTKWSDYIGTQYASQYAREKGWITTKTSTPNNSSAVTNAWNTKAATAVKTDNSNATKATAVPEYQWTGTTKSNNYQNQGEGNYTYNQKSWYYEKAQPSQSSSQSSTQTSTPVSSMDATKSNWDNLSYADQQKKLNEIPWLKDALVKKWWTIKTGDWTPVQAETKWGETPKTDNWDYSDNSPERMKQIADNVNSLAMTDPWIFNNEDSFRKFFIDWKGRTPEQEEFLMDLYRNMKVYNQLDTYPADKIWSMYAHWDVPDSYLNYLKNSNPDRYNEVMDYKDEAEKWIESESYYNTLLANSNEPEWIKRPKYNLILIYKNNDWIDDWLYPEPTDQEKALNDEYSTLASEQLADANAYRDLQADLIEQYPDADMSTILILAWDRGKKIQDRMDTRNVTMTKLQGQIEYLQNERKLQSTARQQTLSQLQKDLWMYYDYTPEWMSELAQAQYAATNVTLDQADSWTDTQKQMALDSVLTPIYEQYGDIIQRPQAQVVNDVMAYAKEKGIWLSQALEENFMKYLKQKPAYQQRINSAASPKVSFEKVWDTGYVFTVNPDGTYSIDTIGGTSLWTNWLYWFTDYTPISTEKKESVLNNFMNTRTEGSDWWQCGEFVNDYLQALWYDRLYDDPIDKKKAVTNSKEATVWSVAVMDSKKYPEYWHVAIVTDVQWDKVKLLESNWNNDEKVHTTRWVNKSDIAWYFDPSKSNATNWSSNWYDPLLEDFFKKDPTKLTKDQWAKLKNMWYDERTFLAMRQEYLKNLSKEPDASTVDILDKLWYLMVNYPWREELMWWLITQYAPWEYGSNMWTYRTYLSQIKKLLTVENLTKLKAAWATFGSLTDWEWIIIEQSAAALEPNMKKDEYLGELLNIYNSYARKSWMWELTLDDINQMYWGKSNSWNTKFNAPSFLQNVSTVSQSNQNWNIDYDARFAEYNG